MTLDSPGEDGTEVILKVCFFFFFKEIALSIEDLIDTTETLLSGYLQLVKVVEVICHVGESLIVILTDTVDLDRKQAVETGAGLIMLQLTCQTIHCFWTIKQPRSVVPLFERIDPHLSIGNTRSGDIGTIFHSSLWDTGVLSNRSACITYGDATACLSVAYAYYQRYYLRLWQSVI